MCLEVLETFRVGAASEGVFLLSQKSPHDCRVDPWRASPVSGLPPKREGYFYKRVLPPHTHRLKGRARLCLALSTLNTCIY